MKILKIAFKNINSLQGEHEIDFQSDPFRTHNLFAITGPTGSGKTTILDVIVLALFNEIPRLGRVSKKEIESKGAILTRSQKDAYARVTYSCVQGIFTSEWSISTARTGNLRDYDMYLSDAVTNEIMVDKKSDVPKKNEELIGLKYDQFVKSVMLAQGAFAEFLRVPKKERSALLEKITGTVIYRKLGMKAYDKFRMVKNTIEDLEKEIGNWEKEILDKDVLTKLKEEHNQCKKSLDTLLSNQKLWTKKVDHKHKILEEQKQLKAWIEREELNKNKLESFDNTEGKRLSRHKMVEPIQQDLIEWNRLQKELKKIDRELSTLSDGLEKVAFNKKKFHEKIEELLGNRVVDSQITMALSDFEKEVKRLQDSFYRKKDRGIALKKEIEADLRPLKIALNKDYKSILTNLQDIQAQADAFFTSQDIESASAEAYARIVAEHEKNLEVLQQARTDAQELNSIQQQQDEIKANLQNLNKVLDQLPQQIADKATALSLAEKEMQNLELTFANQQLVATLEEHRTHLVDGQPCPLCGAIEHPYAAHVPNKNDKELKEKIEKAKETVRVMSNTLSALETTSKLKHQEQAKFNKEVDRLRQLKKEKLQLYQDKYALGLNIPWQEEIQKVKQLIQLYKEAIEKSTQHEITKIVLPKMNQMLEVLEESIALRNQLKERYKGDQPIDELVASYEREWSDIQSQQQRIITQQETLLAQHKVVTTNLEPLHHTIHAHLEVSELSDIDTAFGALLNYDELQLLVQQREELVNAQKEIQINISSLTHIIKELTIQDSSESLSELNDKLAETERHIKITQENLDKTNLALMNQEKYQLKIKELKAKIAEENKNSKHWRILNDLIGDATGNKFNTFAQDLTLAQLLQLANQRLYLLSDRYLVANPVAEEDDSLVVIDKDMGGQRRSVKTLSGGETFVISLALALALSDLASHKVQIRSLFIDEGFGTLDPETLDQTLNTLEQLQDEDGKTIGIISHVASLKERITTQIQVKPNGRGFSTIEIVG